MEKNSKTVPDARYRILEAAGEIFAQSGYRGATVRRICERADVNVASVNYYFRDKEGLYSEVLGYWHEVAVQKYPPFLGLEEGARLEDRLHAFIKSLLLRILDDGKPAWFGKLMAREMTDPTRAFDRLVKETVRPLNKLLASLVQQIMKGPADAETVRLCSASIISQCLYYYSARAVIARLFKGDKSSPGEIEKIAAHIVRFSLRGLRHYADGEAEYQEKRG
jgi:TetR/AcrR family transcriptional regulator, regulator of cefoperazone and chloramphenicol sensitivity